MRKNSIKNTRINGEVLKALANIIRTEVKDPRVGMLTSVTDVEVAPDLKTCKVYISTLDKKNSITDTVRALQNAEGFIRRLLAREVDLRQTPKLTFYEDHSIEYGAHMDKLIEEAVSEISDGE